MKKLSRSEIARRTGLSLSHVSRIFSGERRPSVYAALKIAKALGISVETFIKRLKVEGSAKEFFNGSSRNAR